MTVIFVLVMLKFILLNIILKLVILIAIILSGEFCYLYINQLILTWNNLRFQMNRESKKILVDLYKKVLDFANETVIKPYI